MGKKSVPSPNSIERRRRFLEEEARRLGTTIGISSFPPHYRGRRRRRERARRNLSDELNRSEHLVEEEEEEEEEQPQLVRRPRSERMIPQIPQDPPIEEPVIADPIAALPPVEEDAPIKGEQTEEIDRSNRAILSTLEDLRREEEERVSGDTEILEGSTEIMETDPLTPPEDTAQSQPLISPTLLQIPGSFPIPQVSPSNSMFTLNESFEHPSSPYNPIYERNEEEEATEQAQGKETEQAAEEEDEGPFIVRMATRQSKRKEATSTDTGVEFVSETGPPGKEKKKRKLSKKERIKEMRPRTEPTRTSPRFAAQAEKEAETRAETEKEKEKKKGKEKITEASQRQTRKRKDTEADTGIQVPSIGTALPGVTKVRVISPPAKRANQGKSRTSAEVSTEKSTFYEENFNNEEELCHSPF